MKHETVRASQVNGCAFCVHMHIKEATRHGECPLPLMTRRNLSVRAKMLLASRTLRTAIAPRSRAMGECDERRCLWLNGVDRTARR
ncbi:carboxymuconolactone decarboxylase family protein [Bradyrhizobium sp. IC3195]|uniref:carboxymuconolactone decarboxylase family protein n=1 Tax=Bradyrhizobium sp. IC3195 TaxID=2793804 RepID=UPI001CD6B559|nr:carboxymuconolactone decarboxylase family protein [Bradyrhizobium sp. IC3195]MCA1469909.1 carboxymuconolactone decarboxylase family protein [Bradyrhizobium sp. IC3195]